MLSIYLPPFDRNSNVDFPFVKLKRVKCHLGPNFIHSRTVVTALTSLTRISFGVAQFYPPTDRGNVPSITTAEAGTRFIDPKDEGLG